MILGVQEDAGERVVVGLRNGIVLVVVAARAGHGEAEETAGDHIDAVVALVGAGYFHRTVVVIPGAEAEEAGGRQRLVTGLLVEQVAGELRFDEGWS